MTEHGLQEDSANTSGGTDIFEESEIAEVLAATWKERRTQMSRLQKARRFQQANTIKKQFTREVTDLQTRSRCRRCGQIGHWARNCAQKTGASSSGPKSDKVNGAAMVTEEVLLVSSPGFGVLVSGSSRTLIGQETLNAFMRLYHDRRITVPEAKAQQNCLDSATAMKSCRRGLFRCL